MSAAQSRRDLALDIFARTIWGEARGEGLRGMEAVAAVIMNRVRRRGWFGGSILEVCLKPKQFSCWNEGDSNRAKLLDVDGRNRAFAAARRIARRAEAGLLADPTRGATHYHAAYVFPRWARHHAPSAEIGRHVFYNDVE